MKASESVAQTFVLFASHFYCHDPKVKWMQHFVVLRIGAEIIGVSVGIEAPT
jgi:hypothetical protein